MKIQILKVGQMNTNCYIVADANSSEILVIDPGDDADYIISEAEKYHPVKVTVIATHGHFDHILGAFAITSNYRIPLYLGEKDFFLIERMSESAKYYLGHNEIDPPPVDLAKLKGGDTMSLGKFKLNIVSLPGHTPGSIGIFFRSDHMLFSGDLVFADGSTGRTDSKYGNRSDLVISVNSLLGYPPDTQIYAGHGDQTDVRSLRKLIHLTQ
jgi:hydroxyacylglutathione hydrolase